MSSASYRAVFALPRARALFLTGLPARLCYGLLSIPMLLAVRAGTGSYAVAGTAVGLAGLATALLGPLRARLVERRPGALRPMAGCYALLLLLLAAVCTERQPTALVVAVAVLAGACPPPVGPLLRTAWGRLAADEAQRQSMLSLDTATESTVFALGPVLAGVLIAVSSAATVLVVCAVLALVGFGLLPGALRAVPGNVEVRPGRQRTPLLAAGFVPLLGLVLAVAAALSLVEVAMLAAWGTVTTGVLTTLFSIGGVIGGLLYGRLGLPGELTRRPLLLVAAATACYALPALLCGSPAAALGLLLAGGVTDVLLITAYQLVELLVPSGSRTEAGAWVNTAYNLGAAAGASLGGLLVDHAGPLGTLGAPAALLVVAVLATAPAVLRRRRAERDATA
ncbi:putative MFS family arabinose efflux permease [Kitasatospora sp. GP30]|uniref:MFS transporter n=1 Tax=Kitasatospora sp. GP30 TaxID=3035084 RepID=UPI000C711D2B|nr:MFS transporter [Kitasatospora sp. GP30]MDH6139228.1 putative MFS family arabinose efflux permease [Kitasatospora sp. GP30]